jgi:ABC-type multidrug transport system ATPase subunit/ABC-type uncharacterized transport system permease subunit
MISAPTKSVEDKVNILQWFRKRDQIAIYGINDLHIFQIFVFAAVVICVKLCLDHFLASEAGLAVRALEDARAGANVLRKNNQSPEWLKAISLVAANAMVGLGGVLTALKEQQATANRGTDIFVDSLIAFLLGTQLHGWACLFSNKVVTRDKRGLTELAGWVKGYRISTVSIFGTLLYWALVCFTQRIGGSALDWTRIILVALIALSLGNPPMVQKWLDKHYRRSAKKGEEKSRVADSTEAGTGNQAEAAGNGSVLTVRGLEYSYSSSGPETTRFRFKLQNLLVPRGALIQLRGANGSGKTTFLLLVAGIIEMPERGSIALEGREVTENPEARRKRVAYVDQDYNRGVIETLTVEENIALADIGPTASLWNAALCEDRRSRVHEILKQVELSEVLYATRPSELSGGQRQVVNLLTLLGRRELPPLVLLDEPVNNLDTENLGHCRRIIELLHRRGTAILLVSHNSIEGLQYSAPAVYLADPRTHTNATQEPVS